MEHLTTITGVTSQQTSTGRTMYNVFTEDDERYGVFDASKAQQAEAFKGQPVVIDFNVTEKGFKNLLGVRSPDASTGLTGASTSIPEANPRSAEQKNREIRLAVAFKGAIELAAAGKIGGGEVRAETMRLFDLLTDLSEAEKEPEVPSEPDF